MKLHSIYNSPVHKTLIKDYDDEFCVVVRMFADNNQSDRVINHRTLTVSAREHFERASVFKPNNPPKVLGTVRTSRW